MYSPSIARKCLRYTMLSFVVALSTFFFGTQATADEQLAFATPAEAVQALIDALRSESPAAAVIKILGPDADDIVDSGDPVDDEARRSRFLVAYDEGHQIEQDGDAKATLVIGKDEFPFPIPIVSGNGKWHWDTAAGVDEILTRRIGENELSAIEVMRAYVAAQLEYADKERDGKGVQFARRLLSSEGRRDGLYWPSNAGEEQSPIGPLIAEAQREGYKRRADGEGQPPAYHGYVYNMLFAQGANAAEGAREYIVNDRMIGGFALIATPADYGNSGVMTFIVNQDGIVYEKDLGPDTASEAQKITSFDPDSGWQKIAE